MVKTEEHILFLISFLALILHTNATDMNFIFDSSFDLLEKIGNDEKKQRLISGLLGSEILKKGTLIRKGTQLASGGFGIIYEGSIENLNLIIKQKKSNEKSRGIRKELESSNAFLDALVEKLNQDNFDYDSLKGLKFLVLSIGKTEDGSLIQRRIMGSNLEKNIKNHLAPYNAHDDYPRNLREVIVRTTNFFAALATLHYIGFVHCDIKSGNIMILDDAAAGYPCYIIDFGGLRKIGERIGIHSSNGAPEYIETTFIILKNKYKLKKLKEKQTKIIV
jgi:serine/threonine protein kinase